MAAYLARFKGSSRDHTGSGLRCYLARCAQRGLDPLAARRPHLELCIRWMQEICRFKLERGAQPAFGGFAAGLPDRLRGHVDADGIRAAGGGQQRVFAGAAARIQRPADEQAVVGQADERGLRPPDVPGRRRGFAPRAGRGGLACFPARATTPSPPRARTPAGTPSALTATKPTPLMPLWAHG